MQHGTRLRCARGMRLLAMREKLAALRAHPVRPQLDMVSSAPPPRAAVAAQRAVAGAPRVAVRARAWEAELRPEVRAVLEQIEAKRGIIGPVGGDVGVVVLCRACVRPTV